MATFYTDLDYYLMLIYETEITKICSNKLNFLLQYDSDPRSGSALGNLLDSDPNLR
jgi:hypothetical protein